MKYIDVKVRTALISHGFDANNQPVEEALNETDYVRKLVAVERIRSVSEQYLLVSSQNDREAYWEYQGSLEDIKRKLLDTGVSVA